VSKIVLQIKVLGLKMHKLKTRPTKELPTRLLGGEDEAIIVGFFLKW